MTVAVTGHRPDKLGYEYDMRGPISKAIYSELGKFVDQLNPNCIISGMALGVDMIFANLAINRGIPLVCAVPFKGQESKWPESSRKVYNKMLSLASEVRYISDPGYGAWKMQVRNKWMVDHSDVLLAVWDGSEGGTCNCVNYAVDRGIDIRRINPKELSFHVKP